MFIKLFYSPEVSYPGYQVSHMLTKYQQVIVSKSLAITQHIGDILSGILTIYISWINTLYW